MINLSSSQSIVKEKGFFGFDLNKLFSWSEHPILLKSEESSCLLPLRKYVLRDILKLTRKQGEMSNVR